MTSLEPAQPSPLTAAAGGFVSAGVIAAHPEHPAMLQAASRRNRARLHLRIACTGALAAAAWAAWPVRTSVSAPEPDATPLAKSSTTSPSPASSVAAASLSTIWPDAVEAESPPVRLVAILPGPSFSAWVTRVSDGATLRISAGSQIDGWHVVSIHPKGVEIRSPRNARLDLPLRDQAAGHGETGPDERLQAGGDKQ